MGFSQLAHHRLDQSRSGSARGRPCRRAIARMVPFGRFPHLVELPYSSMPLVVRRDRRAFDADVHAFGWPPPPDESLRPRFRRGCGRPTGHSIRCSARQTGISAASLIIPQRIWVISSPSISTMGTVILIFSIATSCSARRSRFIRQPVEQNLALARRSCSYRYSGDWLRFALVNKNGRKLLVAPSKLFAHVGNDRQSRPASPSNAVPSARVKGQHAPVDAVGAVALCGKLIADVCAAAQNALAGGGLFARRAVAGLVGEYDRADTACAPTRSRANLKDVSVPRQASGGTAPAAREASRACVALASRHIIRVAAREREFRQLQGVGAIGRCLAGGDQLIGGRHRVVHDGRPAP